MSLASPKATQQDRCSFDSIPVAQATWHVVVCHDDGYEPNIFFVILGMSVARCGYLGFVPLVLHLSAQDFHDSQDSVARRIGKGRVDYPKCPTRNPSESKQLTALTMKNRVWSHRLLLVVLHQRALTKQRPTWKSSVCYQKIFPS